MMRVSVSPNLVISPEVLRHIRGDGHGVQLGALPKTIQERKLRVKWQRQSMSLLSFFFGLGQIQLLLICALPVQAIDARS